MLATKTIDLLLKQTEQLTEETAMSQPFLIYAACHWHTHIAALGDLSLWPVDLPETVDCLFTEPTIYLNWSRIRIRAHSSLHWNRVPQNCISPIQCALDYSLIRTVEIMASQGADILKGGHDSVLMKAVTRGHFELVDSLLKENPPMTEAMVMALMQQLKLDEASDDYEVSKMRLRTVMNTMREVGLLGDFSQASGKNLSSSLLRLAAFNRSAGLEMIRLLLEWHDTGLFRLSFPEDLLSVVVWDADHKEEIFDLLFANCHDEITISTDILDSRSGTFWFSPFNSNPNANGPFNYDIIANIVVRKPNLFMEARSWNSMAQLFSTKTMESMLQACHIRVTQDVLASAALNEFNPDMLSFLWPRREPGVSITEDIFINVTSWCCSIDVLQFMIEKLEPGTRLSDYVMNQVIEHQEGLFMMEMLRKCQRVTFEVSAEMIEIAISRCDDALEMLEILDLFRTNGTSKVPVTETMVSAAAGHCNYAHSLISYLSSMQEQPIPVTENALMNAALQTDPLVVDILMDNFLDVPLSDRVFVAACSNPQLLSRLLDRRSDCVLVDQIVAKIAYIPSAEVLNLLFDKKLLDVNEQLLEAMAGTYETLTNVLSRAPDMPITRQVLLKASNDPRSLRLLLEKRSVDDLLIEEILIAAVRRCSVDNIQQVIQAIMHRTGAVPITENVILAASDYFVILEIFPWLFDQLRISGTPFTEKTLLAATRCCKADQFQQVVKDVINHQASAPITRHVLLAVLSDRNLFELSPWLLNQPRSSDEPFTEDILIVAAKYFGSDQFQQFVKAMIDCTGSAPLTENVFLAVLCDGELCRACQWLLDQRQNIHNPSIEDILIGATNLHDSEKLQKVVENLIDHIGSAPITEEMLRATICNGLINAFRWLFDQRQDVSVTLEGICDTIFRDMETPARSKIYALVCFTLPCEYGRFIITPSALAKYPYDLEQKINYGLEDLIDILLRGYVFDGGITTSGYETMPSSDLQAIAEILLERCGLVAVGRLLEVRPEIVISEALLQAAKKNVIANQDDLISLLEMERNSRAMALE
ncbi:unnamed protein product [Penicillium salamii]|nr:unnamed protein product [Penicillium salamii]CAG8429480.1 unnamed protein product [Penicillium salamii]